MDESKEACQLEISTTKELESRIVQTANQPVLPTFVADQTPTPTRFIKNCEEAGIFQLIEDPSCNPFDSDFRCAATTKNESQLREDKQAYPLCSTKGSINNDNLSTSITTFSPLSLHMSSPQRDGSMVTNEELYVQAIMQLSNGSLTTLYLPFGTVCHANASSPQSSAAQSSSPTILPKTELSASSFVTLPQRSVGGIRRDTKEKLLAHMLQNQQSTPSIVSAAIAPSALALRPPAKLIGKSVRSNEVSLNLIAKHNSEFLSEDVAPKIPRLSDQQDVSASAGMDTSALSYGLHDESSMEDDEDKRKKFLESNRAAASRCRNKKKIWLNNLERKAADLQNMNKRLSQETARMRQDIAELKRILEKHGNCPPSYPKYVAVSAAPTE